MTFDEQVAKYLKRPAIQAQIKAHYKKTGGSTEDITQVIGYAQKAVAAIIDSLPDSLRKSYNGRAIKTTDLIIGDPIVNDNGDYEITLIWNPQAIHRESLYSDDEGYPEGVQNIVALLSTGVRPIRHDVFGDHMWGKYWHESTRYFIPAGWSRPADPFLKNAIAKYNADHKKDGVVLIPPPGIYY